MDRRAKVQPYEQIRRDTSTVVERGIARKLGIHRRMVRGGGEHSTGEKQNTGERKCLLGQNRLIDRIVCATTLVRA